MSFTSALDDFMNIKKEQDNNRLPPNPPLQQGQTYLKDRSKMCREMRGNLNLIEGFQDQSGTDNNATVKLTQPVGDRNVRELQQLQEMQRSLQATASEWGKKYQEVVTLAKGQPLEMQKCLAACRQKKDVDAISACMYGCNIGSFASRGPTERSTQDPGGPPWWAFLVDAVVIGGEIAATVLTGGAAAIGAVAGDVAVAEGFMPNAPNTTGQASDNTPSRGMGTYGPTGYGKNVWRGDDYNARMVTGKMINTSLASNPVKGQFDLMKQFDNTSGWNFTKGNSQEDNPKGQFALRNAALTNAAIHLSSNLANEPLVTQMANTNIDATNIGQYLEKLRKNWKQTFAQSCKIGIGGFGTVSTGTGNIESPPFAGHTQYCKAWVPTSDGRSGYYDIQAGTVPFTVDPVTGEKKALVGVPISLANRGELGCDTVIPGTRDYAVDQGGAGFCECKDGTNAGYVDEGHPSFTCNQVCAPENKALRSQPLYHNAKNWKPALPYNQYHSKKTPTPADELRMGKAATGPFVQCGKLQSQPNGTYAQGTIPDCPSGMKAAPDPVSADPICGTKSWEEAPCYATCEEVPCGGGCYTGCSPSFANSLAGCPPGVSKNWCTCNIEGTECPNSLCGNLTNRRQAGNITQNGRRCMVLAPAGYSKPLVDNIGKLGKLPTKSQLLDACDGGDGDPPYANIYLDILELKVLGLVMQLKAAIIYKAIKESYSGSNAAALQRSTAGKSILKNMKLYEGAYKRLRAQENLNLQRGGMLEDIRLKNKSTNISYYLWFALAISGMALVIKKLNN